MSEPQLAGAEKFVCDLASDGVVAIVPRALAEHLDTDDVTATRLLDELQTVRQLVYAAGHIECLDCGSSVPLEGQTISRIREDAIRLAKGCCPRCNAYFPNARHLQVYLSFFCRPAARRAAFQPGAGNDAPVSAPHAVTSTPIPLQTLITMNVAGDAHLPSIHAGANARVNVDSSVGPTANGDIVSGVKQSSGRDSVVDGKRETDSDGVTKSPFLHPVVIAAVVTGVLAVMGIVLQQVL